MYRTPAAKTVADEKSPSKATNVRRSIDCWEAANTDPTPVLLNMTKQAGPANIDPTPVSSRMVTQASPSNISLKFSIPVSQQGSQIAATQKISVNTHTPPKTQYVDKISEARACLTKAKIHLRNSRNIKTELKNGITEALDRLYQLVIEAQPDAIKKKNADCGKGTAGRAEAQVDIANTTFSVSSDSHSIIVSKLEEHSEILLETNKRIEELKLTIENQKVALEQANTYASATAAGSGNSRPKRTTLHSVVVTSNNEVDTGDEVLDKVRKAVDAKEGWIKVERVRKAKDRKVIMGFETRADRDKAKDRLQKEGVNLTVEEVKNKDPLLILKGILSVNTDEDILKALRNQNRSIFHGIEKEEDRLEIRYRRRARNPHIGHVVLSVSPTIWRRAIECGHVHVDLQRVRVEDQSPLVQCTRCLGYGHGKRFCKETADLCSHCGGPHLKTECADWFASVPPSCHNCTKAKMDQVDHNAFSSDCPIRRKWDRLARSAVAYC